MRRYLFGSFVLFSVMCMASCSSDEDKEVLCLTSCSGNTAYSCLNGVSFAKQCPNGCQAGRCLNETDAGCTQDSVQCSSTGVVQKCFSGVWIDQVPCSQGTSCISGACVPDVVPVCVEGAVQCSASGVLQRCIGHSWQDQLPCPEGTICTNGGCVSDLSCQDGERQCSGNVPVICSNGVWTKLSACEAGTTCEAGDCKSKGCTTGSLKCDGNSPMACVDGKWTTGSACSAGENCVLGRCVAKNDLCTEGSVRCSADGIPQKCVDGAWVGLDPCRLNEKCSVGSCVEKKKELCWNKECGINETCTNSVCVPNSELGVAKGAKCNPDTWVDYCMDDGTAVSCATTSGVYYISCPNGCKVGDFTMLMDGKPWFPAFCDTSWSQKCSALSNEIPYCQSEKKSSGEMVHFESTYQCVPAMGGGFFGMDYAGYDFYTNCKHGCDEDKKHCAVPTCDERDHCTGDVYSYCKEGVIEKLDCEKELEAVCREFSSVGKIECYDDSDLCEKEGNTRTRCDSSSMKGTLITYTCLKADNEPADKLYWVKTKTEACSGDCDSERIACAK